MFGRERVCIVVVSKMQFIDEIQLPIVRSTSMTFTLFIAYCHFLYINTGTIAVLLSCIL